MHLPLPGDGCSIELEPALSHVLAALKGSSQSLVLCTVRRILSNDHRLQIIPSSEVGESQATGEGGWRGVGLQIAYALLGACLPPSVTTATTSRPDQYLPPDHPNVPPVGSSSAPTNVEDSTATRRTVPSTVVPRLQIPAQSHTRGLHHSGTEVDRADGDSPSSSPGRGRVSRAGSHAGPSNQKIKIRRVSANLSGSVLEDELHHCKTAQLVEDALQDELDGEERVGMLAAGETAPRGREDAVEPSTRLASGGAREAQLPQRRSRKPAKKRNSIYENVANIFRQSSNKDGAQVVDIFKSGVTGAQHAEAARAGSVSGGNWLRATLRRSVSSFRGASNPQELEARAGSFTGGGGVGGLNKRTVSWTSRARQPPEEATSEEDKNRKDILRHLVEEMHAMQGDALPSDQPPVWWMMHPKCILHRYWDFFVAFNLVYTMLSLPMRICFSLEGFTAFKFWWWIEQLVNIVFVWDIVVNFTTGVYVTVKNPDADVDEHNDVDDFDLDMSKLSKPEEVLSYEMSDIAYQYLKCWFWVDFIGVCPWENILPLINQSSSSLSSAPRFLKLFRLTRLLKLLRVLRLRKLHHHLVRLIPSPVLQLSKMAITVSLLAHYVACGFYFIAVLYDDQGRNTWLERYLEEDPNNVSVGSLYLSSVYWAFCTITTVGYGDIVPVTHAEKTYALCVMYTGVATMSAITSKLTTILAQFGAQEANVRSEVDSARSYCKYRNLPPALKKNVTDYFEVRAAQRAVCDEQAILRDMSPSLKARVVCYIFGNVIETIPFFQGCSDLFLAAVLCCLEPQLYAPTDVIIQRGQREASMFIIAKGSAGMMNKDGKLVQVLQQGSYFGEIGLFFETRRTTTICSITFCDVFKLTKFELDKVHQKYPDMRDIIVNQAEDMFQNSMTCYICGAKGHISIQCKGTSTAVHATAEVETIESPHYVARKSRVGFTASTEYDPYNTLDLATVAGKKHAHGASSGGSHLALSPTMRRHADGTTHSMPASKSMKPRSETGKKKSVFSFFTNVSVVSSSSVNEIRPESPTTSQKTQGLQPRGESSVADMT
mmetsp:Transcript_46662/g.86904  ORF Transcript_46662/g.86904 Transcript_46662/m.86904 type:complete len:1054 (-) Transcript_46662:193-3354(-)